MVLIISDNKDKTVNRVIEWLRFYNCEFLRINSEDVVEIKYLAISNSNKEVVLVINETEINISLIKFIWCRRGYLNVISKTESKDVNKYFCDYSNQIIEHLKEEKNELLNYLSFLFKKIPHLNNFNEYHINKLVCLDIASTLGFKIPSSKIITNLNKNESNTYITKSIKNNPNIIDIKNGHQYFNLTRRVNLRLFKGFFFYSLLQNEVEKNIEVRSFVIFDKIFSMAIFSQSDPNTIVDFRSENRIKQPRYIPYKLPKSIESKVFLFMKLIGINSGSIDFILSKDSEYYFLEINPVGQFDALSHLCNYNIEKYIATEIKKHNEK